VKVLIFDSGTIINFSMNGLLYLLEELKKNFDGKFIITGDVKYEIIDRPLKVSRFELEALRVKRLLDLKILEMPTVLKIDPETIKAKTRELMDKANHKVKSEGQWIKIVSDAEMSCLALSSILHSQKIENIIAIDERTTRILSEKPKNLEKIMTRKLRKRVKVENGGLKEFAQFRFLRSSELVYVAHKKGLLKVKGPLALEAALFATKFKGSSITFDELKELKRL